MTRLDVAIAGARIAGIVSADAAVKSLEASRAESVTRGIPKFEFQGRRAIAEIERRRNPAIAARLNEELKREATRHAVATGLYVRDVT